MIFYQPNHKSKLLSWHTRSFSAWVLTTFSHDSSDPVSTNFLRLSNSSCFYFSSSLIRTLLNFLPLVSYSLSLNVISSGKYSLILLFLNWIHFSPIVVTDIKNCHILPYYLASYFVSLFRLRDWAKSECILNYSHLNPHNQPPCIEHDGRSTWYSINDGWWIKPFHRAGLS